MINSSVAKPSLSIVGFSGAVSPSGTTFPFVVTLSAASSATTTVSYTTVSGSATSPGVFTAESGTLTFAPGVTSQTINVPIVATNLTTNESFTVQLSSPTNATLNTATATGTILAFTPSSYSGWVFIDPSEASNPAGAAVKTSEEVALQGVTLTLTGTSSVTNAAVSQTTFSGADGSYSFGNMTPGTYTITETVPSGLIGPEAISNGKVVGTNQISLTIAGLGGVTSTNDNFAFSGVMPGSPLMSQRGYLSSTNPAGTIVVSSNTVVTPSVSPAVTAAITPAVTSADGVQSLPSNIVQSGSTLTVTGTGANDSFNFSAGGATDTLTYNGTSYQFDATAVKSVVFNGTGKESATVTDTSGKATADLSLGSGIVTGPGYTVTINNVAAIALNGTGADRATLHDSALANNLFGSGDLAMLTNSAGLSVSVNDIETVTVDTDGGGSLTKHLGAIDFALSEL